MPKAKGKIVEFECSPENLIFKADDTDYKIYAVVVDRSVYPDVKLTKYGNATILGDLHDLGIMAKYHVTAEEQNTPRGYSYKVKNIRRIKPTNEFATRMFLEEILTHGQVDVLMDVYPNIVDKIINNDLGDIDLSKTKGIKEYTFEVIKRKVEENFVFAEIVDMFDGLINFQIIKKLYEKYPSSILIKEAIETKPYQTLCGMSRVGFKTADSTLLLFEKELKQFKAKGGTPKIEFIDNDLRTSRDRCYGVVEYTLQENSSNGHTRMTLSSLKKEVENLAKECSGHLKDVIQYDEFHIDKPTKSIALKTSYEAELKVSILIKKMLSNDFDMKISEEELLSYKVMDDGELTDDQFNGLRNFVKYGISGLVGFAGTGKSFSTQPIIKFMDDHNMTYRIMAPTGRASKVISGYTNRQAYTIHRGLGYMGYWSYNEENKLDVDVVMIDEMSMSDVHLILRVLEAVNYEKTRILLIGDNEQLPSVGEGNFLHDIIHSGVVPTTMLKKVFRYGSGGMLTVATKIRNGEEFIENKSDINKIGTDESYIYIPTSQQRIKRNMIAIYKKLLKSGKSPEDIMVLTSYNKGEYGTIALNKELQYIANQNYGSDINVKIGSDGNETTYYVGDIVLQYQNNYKAEIYIDDKSFWGEPPVCFISNGDIGKIVDIYTEDGNQYIVIEFDDNTIRYHKAQLQSNINLAYSISIHKSQGGSVDTAILLVPKAHTYMLNSNLLYVGSTRARSRVYCVGEPDTINRAIKKKANFDRKTFLKDLLAKA